MSLSSFESITTLNTDRYSPLSLNSERIRENMKGRGPTKSDIYATLVVAAFLALIWIYGNTHAAPIAPSFFSRGINFWPESSRLPTLRALENMRWIKT